MTLVTRKRFAGQSVSRSISCLVSRCVGLALIVILAGSSLLAQTTLTVAAAADLQPLLRDTVNTYEALKHNRELVTGKEIALVFGSSGNLATQIENGAPYDIFFSADSGFARRLVNEGRAIPDSFHVYAIGKLAIWVPAGSHLDVEQLGAKVILDPTIRKIAIANPQHAPYGRAAVEAMKYLGIYEQVESKLVLGENVSQAVQFVTSGNAQVGIVALSLVLGPEMKNGHRWVVPQKAYTPLLQAVVIVSGTKHPEAAKAFVDYFLYQRDPDFLPRYGFDLPPREEAK